MGLMLAHDSIGIWQEAVKNAENRCAISLHPHLESYLVSLLMRYTNQPELVNKVMAKAFMEALSLECAQRQLAFQTVGDQCLLFAGFYPQAAERKHVNLRYFVDLGRTAYSAVSDTTNDLFGSLAVEFVVLMDVLQSIPANTMLLPLEAYEQWSQVGSVRAWRALQTYTRNKP